MVLLSAVCIPSDRVGASAGDGWTREASSILGPTPLGLRVIVDKTAADHDALWHLALTVTQQLHGYGLPLTFVGYGATSQTVGKLVITESQTACGGGAGAVTRTVLQKLADWHTVIQRASISVCPGAFGLGAWKTLTILRHEFGHAVGLGHFNAMYDGQWQVMLGNDVRARDYQAGDRAGLNWIVRNRAAIRARYPLTQSGVQRWDSGLIVVTGTAVNPADRTASLNVTLTDNGLTASAAVQVDPRTHAYTVAWRWPGSGIHVLCARVRNQSGLSTSSVCARWN